MTFLIRLCFYNDEATLSLDGHRLNAKWSASNVTSCDFKVLQLFAISSRWQAEKEMGVGKRRRRKVMGCTGNETSRQKWNEGLGRWWKKGTFERNANEDRTELRKRRRGLESGAVLCFWHIWHGFNSSNLPAVCLCWFINRNTHQGENCALKPRNDY